MMNWNELKEKLINTKYYYFHTENGILLCGDCLEILPLIPDESIDLILTDPPYMISQEIKIARSQNYKYKGKDIDLDFGPWDSQWQSKEEYINWCKTWWKEGIRVLKDYHHFLFFFDKAKISYAWDYMEENGMKGRSPVFWIKLNPCLLPDSLVFDINGILKITEAKKVLTKEGKFEFCKKIVRNYKRTVYKIVPYGIDSKLAVWVTEEHPFLIIKKQMPKKTWKQKKDIYFKGKEYRKKIFEKIKQYKNWVTAKEVQINDFVIFPRIKFGNKSEIIISYFKRGYNVKPIEEKLKLNKDLGWLLGIYLAEGCNAHGNHVAWYLSLKEIDLANKIKNIVEKYFKCKVKIKKEKWKLSVQAENNRLWAFLKNGGKLAWKKKISENILQCKKEILQSLIYGFWEGDGCIVNSKKEKYISFSTTSPHLAGQIFIILLALGYIPSIRVYNFDEKSQKNAIIKHKHPIFRIDIRGKEQVEDFLNKKYRKKRQTHKGFVDENFVYIPIRKILTNEYSGKVFDLSLEKEHNFLTPSGIVHNCPRARRVDFMKAIEMCLWFTKKEVKVGYFNYQLGQHPDYFMYSIPQDNSKEGKRTHPTQKPVAFCKWLISYLSNENEIVLDLFLGSGTTAIACEKLGRKWIGIEIDKTFCEIAKQRILKEIRQLKLF